MGHLVNPIGQRLGYTRYWSSIWSTTSYNYQYMYLYKEDWLLSQYFHHFFKNNNYFYKHQIVLSHITVMRFSNNKIKVNLFFYDNKLISHGLKINKVLSDEFIKTVIEGPLRINLKRTRIGTFWNVARGEDLKKHESQLSSRNLDFNFLNLKDNFNFSEFNKNYLAILNKLRFNSLRKRKKSAFASEEFAPFHSFDDLPFKDVLCLQSMHDPFLVLDKVNISCMITGYLSRKILLDLNNSLGTRIIHRRVRYYKLAKLMLYFNFKSYFKSFGAINFSFYTISTRYFSALIMSRYMSYRYNNGWSLGSMLFNVRQLFFSHNRQYRNLIGLKIACSGRFNRKTRAHYKWIRRGRMSLSTFDLPLDYGFSEVTLKYGICGIKVWVAYDDESLNYQSLHYICVE